MSPILCELARKARQLAEGLGVDGWDRPRGLRLAHFVAQIIEECVSSQCLEAAGRARELAELLDGFVQETPSNAQLLPVLHAVAALAGLLEEAGAVAYVERKLLPKRPEEWLFVLVGSLADLAESLRYLGFKVTVATTIDEAVDACRAGQVILLARAAWLVDYAERLTAGLSELGDSSIWPLRVAFAEAGNYRAQLGARKLGARILPDPAADVSRLVAELSGLAWKPRNAYRVMLVDSDAVALNRYACVLRDAGLDVLASDDPLLALGAMAEFAPEACMFGLDMPACRGTDLAALLRLDQRYLHLPVIYLAAGAEVPEDVDGADFLVKPVAPELLTQALSSRARQFRRLDAAQIRQVKLQVTDALQQARDDAEHADKAKVEGFAGWGQELRELLNALLGHAQFLQANAALDFGSRRQLDEIVTGGAQGVRMIGDLFERIGIGNRADTDSAPGKPMMTETDAKPERRRILVAEDNPANQMVLRMQLNVLGFDADIAANGAEAMAKWQGGGHDLILADRHMPGMDGLELTRAIRAGERESGAYVPIIAITAVQYPEEQATCREAGMDDVLPKPIELDALRGMLERWLPCASPLAPASEPAPVMVKTPAAILDVGYLVSVIGDSDPQQTRELVDLFTTTVRGDLPACRRHIDEGSSRGLALAMHKLKSSARMVGALRFAELAQTLEDAAKAENWPALTATFVELEYALEDVEIAAGQLVTVAGADGAAVSIDAALPRRVLVVDDDPVARRQISMLLAGFGINEVVAVDSAAAALLEIARSDDIDLLISDLNMPGMDGIEFLRQLVDSGFQKCIVIISGVDDKLLQATAELFRAQGMQLRGALKKPVAREMLLESLTMPCDVAASANSAPAARISIAPDDIVAGIRRDEFTVHFQPKVDAATLRVVGVEALARWQRDGKPVPPDEFIITAERHGLIGELSEVLLTKALIGGAQLADAGYPMTVAVNLSANWLTDIRLPEFILASIQITGFKAEHLVLEITETGVMGDMATAMDVMTRLRLKGFKLSIDDFGTGYSSLEQLQRIPFNELKLDRSFVRGAGEKSATRIILASTLTMAKKLKLATVAEGVETQADLDLVRGLGCDFVQGWLIAKAMPLDQLLEWLKRRGA
ncbi:MAG: EAL domain-containing protein [Methylovulum sp.]|nr:EAL domain-containing protein [Methylovulum sp.]